MKLLEIKPTNESVPVGKIIAQNKKLLAGCKDDSAIEIIKIQMEGKGPMGAEDFINGFKNLLN
jgi:methionyl-tRNA formyltransferase